MNFGLYQGVGAGSYTNSYYNLIKDVRDGKLLCELPLLSPDGKSSAGWTVESGGPLNLWTGYSSPAPGETLFQLGTSASTLISQKINLVDAGISVSDIDNQSINLVVYAYMWGWTSDPDYGQIGIRPLTDNNVALTSDNLSGAFAYDSPTLCSYSYTLPAGTRKLALLFKGTRQNETNLDVYITLIKIYARKILYI